jgi:hypothetical protein
MPDDDAPDLSTFPTGLDIPDQLTAQAADTTVETQNFTFCILFLGRPWHTMPVSAPDYELAVLTISQLVQLFNQTLERMGYPPNCCSWRDGSC